MYSCAQVVRMVSSDEVPRLGRMDRLQVRLHLSLCRYCSKFARQLDALRRAVKGVNPPVPEDEIERARGRIMDKLSDK